MAATRFPRYWDYNALRLEVAAPDDLTAEALAAEADKLQSGLGHRKIECEDESSGHRLTRGLEKSGWRVTRLAWMRYEAARVEPAHAPDVVEVDVQRVRHLKAQWLGTEDLGTPTSIDHFLDDEESVALLLPGHATTLAAVDAAGEPIAFCTLRIAGECGDLEDLYCAPASREHGLASALVRSAITRALDGGAKDLFIVADQDDWPKDLYARLGFRTVWVRHDAVLRPA